MASIFIIPKLILGQNLYRFTGIISYDAKIADVYNSETRPLPLVYKRLVLTNHPPPFIDDVFHERPLQTIYGDTLCSDLVTAITLTTTIMVNVYGYPVRWVGLLYIEYSSRSIMLVHLRQNLGQQQFLQHTPFFEKYGIQYETNLARILYYELIGSYLNIAKHVVFTI